MRLPFFAFALLSGLVGPKTAPAQATLSVVVELVKLPSPGAQLRIAVCPNMYAFILEHQCITLATDAQAPVTRVEIPDLKPGEYAVKVYVDDNDNHELDIGKLGLPEESFGYSNNATRLAGPPSFDEAKINVTDGMNIARIKMQ